MINFGNIKAPLSKQIEQEYNSLINASNTVSHNYFFTKIIDGTGGKVSIANIFAYQIGWGELLIQWYESGIQNKIFSMPGEGFTTWDYTEIAQYFYKKYEQNNIEKIKEEIFNTVAKIIAITEYEYELQRLDKLGIWPWCTLKSDKQWPLSKWITVNTVAPYKRARILIKKHIPH